MTLQFVVMECDERGIPSMTYGPFADVMLAKEFAREHAEASVRSASSDYPGPASDSGYRVRYANEDGCGDDWYEVQDQEGDVIEYWHIQAIFAP